MRQTILGASGISVSTIAFGAMSLTGDSAHDQRLIHRALELGINMIDTADLYQQGDNERIIGQAINGRREEVVLASKGGNQLAPDGKSWTWNPNPDYLRRALEASLKRLGTDYLDLYQLHGGTMEDPKEEVIRFFEEERKRGTIRAYGISSIRPTVIDYWLKHAEMDTLMLQYSALDRRAEEQIFPMLTEQNVTVLARGTLAKGLLAGKPAREYLGISAAEIADIVGQAFPEKQQSSRAASAIRYALAPKEVAVAVVGASSFPQLKEAVEAGRIQELSSQEKQYLDRLLPRLMYKNHRLER